MAYCITCPACGATLKAKRPPRNDKKLTCVKCAAAFTLNDLRPAEPAPKREPANPRNSFSDAALMPRVLLGAFALIVVGGAITAAVLAMRPAPTAGPTKIADAPTPPAPVPVTKSEPKADPQPEPKVDAEAERRRNEFTSFMIDGGIATQLRKFDDAVKAYESAIKLVPDDADAKQKLAVAQEGLKELQETRRQQEKQKAEIDGLVKKGDDALEREQLPEAVEFFKQALERSPLNDEAAQKLLLAQNRLQQAEAERRKLEAFDQHIIIGKAALKAGRAREAMREFTAAGKLLPNDPLPPELLKDAEKLFAENPIDGDRKKQYQMLLDDGKTFLQAKKLDQAEDSFRQALKLFPNDPDAQRGLNDTLAASKKAKGDAGKAIAKAQAAINAQQVPQAMQILRDADRAFPNDSDILRAIQIAELIQVNRVAYFQAIVRGNQAMALRDYSAAILAYSAALQLVPGDPQAAIGLLEAQRGLNAMVVVRANYDAAIAQAMTFLRAQNYVAAAQAFERAFALCQPPLLVDPQVQLLARYAVAMAQGNAALAAQQYQQALQSYQVALSIIPNDIAAQTGIARIRFALSRGRAG
jgi:tetratricopeptide (TPR) repeat protein